MSAATDIAMGLDKNMPCKLCLITMRFSTRDALIPVGWESRLSLQNGQDTNPTKYS